MKNMNEVLEDFVQAIAHKMGFTYDVTASLTWTDTFGPTVRRIESSGEVEHGDFYVSNGLLHSNHCGHKAVFTVSVPGHARDGFIMNWVRIELGNLTWDPDGFRYDAPVYSMPEAVTKGEREDFDQVLRLATVTPEIMWEFNAALINAKAFVSVDI